MPGLGGRQYGDEFRILKKYTVSVLKKFGFVERGVMEKRIQDEAVELVKYVKSKNGQAFDMEPILHMSALNIIYNLMFGQRFDMDDKTGRYLSDGVIYYLKSLHPVFDLFPILRFLPMLRDLLENIDSRSKKWKEFFDTKVDECLKDTSGRENFVQEFAQEAGDYFDKTELYFIIKDLINGGTDTSATQLLWALILIGNNPAVQEHLHREIDMVVPGERLPMLEDKPKLPYLEATLFEVMRLKPIVPLAVPHTALRDTEAGGYFIPANTQVTFDYICLFHFFGYNYLFGNLYIVIYYSHYHCDSLSANV